MFSAIGSVLFSSHDYIYTYVYTELLDVVKLTYMYVCVCAVQSDVIDNNKLLLKE